jgi:List-Bact-rpt repeat protein
MAFGPTGRRLPSRSNRSYERFGPLGGLGLLVPTALFALFLLASPARAAGPYFLEIAEDINGTGFGTVACKYTEGGKSVEEEPCKEDFEVKKSVTLIPVPEIGSKFVAFTTAEGSAAACKGLTKPCTFTIGTSELDAYVEARFDEITPKLTISQTGEGEVWCETILESGLCEPEEEYEYGTELTLSGEPAEGWQFLGFKSGTGSATGCVGLECTITLEADSTVSAPFAPVSHTLTIAKAGTGQGTVTCNDSTCASSYPDGAGVVLKATAASGSTFAGWSGEGCSGTGTCTVTMLANAVVTATFQASSPTGAQPKEQVKEGKARVGAIAKVRSGKAKVKLACSGGPCAGTLRLTAKVLLGGKRRSALIGRRPFSLADGASQTFKVVLYAVALRELKKLHSLKARAGGSGVLSGAVKLKRT